MNKKALFFSIAIATFILATLGGVFSGYQAYAKSGEPGEMIQTASQDATPTNTPVTFTPTNQQVTPEQAASIAGAYIGQQDIYAVESAVLDSMTVFKVTFSSGILVFVGLDGQILRVVQQPDYSESQPSTSSIITEHSADDDHENEEDD